MIIFSCFSVAWNMNENTMRKKKEYLIDFSYCKIFYKVRSMQYRKKKYHT